MRVCEGKNHGVALRARSMLRPWWTRAPRRAACASATLPAPPISNAKVPSGWRAWETAWRNGRRVCSSRRIQWRAALEKALVNVPGLSAGDSARYRQSWTCHVRFGIEW